MNDKLRRKELAAQYKQEKRQAGIYRVIHNATGRYYLSHSRNMKSTEGRLKFALSTGSYGFLDKPLIEMIDEYGRDALEFEVLETLEFDDDISRDKMESELAALLDLWREKFTDSR
jgi:hypothetical protein